MNQINFSEHLHDCSKAERFALKLKSLAIKNAGNRLDNRQASIKTREESVRYAFKVGKLIWGLGYQVEKIENVSGKHIDSVLKYVWQTNKCAGTYSVWISQLRKLVKWLGLPIKIDREKFIPEEELHLIKRETAARKSKSLTGNNIDVGEIIERADALDKRFGAMVRLELVFGLRREEVLGLRPHVDVERDCLLIRRNIAKGGRPRIIRINTEKQREALKYAQSLVGLTDHLGWPPKNDMLKGQLMKVNRQRYHYLMRKIGLTKDQLGATGHALRAEFAERSALARGFVPPTLGGGRGQLPKDEERLVKLKIAEDMGHSRISVTGAYYGSYRSVQVRAAKLGNDR